MQSFNELDLKPELFKAIAELGYETPSPIQAQALPILLGPATDFLGLAATGTGKTAAFSLPLLQRLDPQKKMVQALVLCPTRELAIQVSGQINLLGKYLGIKSIPIYGGASYGDQIHGLKTGAAIVVGTPGRVIDHMERGTLKLENVQTLILDEADEMVSMGFKDELEKILSQAPRETSQVWFFSATMGQDVRRVANAYLRNPQEVKINKTEVLSSTVEQFFFYTHESDKPDVICKLVDAAEDFYGLIFCQTKALVTDLTQYLAGKGYRADCLHGDMDQTARERTMRAFRDKRVNILICTDVASRGLDVKDVTHVINYSLPREFDNYVHRIGRTARSGKSGLAYNLVTPSHRGLIFQIERVTKSRMKEGQIPSRREIAAKKISRILPQFKEEAFFNRPLEVMTDEWKEVLSAMPSQEVAARFLAILYRDIFVDQEHKKPADRMPGPVIRSEVSSRPPREARREGPRREERREDRRDERRVERPEARRDERRMGRPEERPEGRRDAAKPRWKASHKFSAKDFAGKKERSFEGAGKASVIIGGGGDKPLRKGKRLIPGRPNFGPKPASPRQS